MARNKKKILLLGSSGSLGQALHKSISNNNNFVISSPNSKELNFFHEKSKNNLFKILKKKKTVMQ